MPAKHPTRISALRARPVLDSRGNPTVEAVLALESGAVGRAIAPSGASTGTLEALELRDGGKAWGGKGVGRAVENVNNVIARALKGIDAADQEAVDAAMLELDGTGNKSRLGANATVAVSMAALQAAAAADGRGAYALLGGTTLPLPFLNVINGGKHAGSGLAVQEFMLAPTGFRTFGEALRASVETYHTLGAIIAKQYGPAGKNLGDEGGFAPTIRTCREAADLLLEAIDQAGYAGKVKLGSDAAASSFYDEGSKTYRIDGKDLDQGELLDYWASFCADYPLVSLEDPFEESDFSGFRDLKAKVGARTQIVGDDLTVTSLKRVKKARDEKAISALLLKVNQVGTVSESVEAARFCQKHRMGVMVSHRSGESEDTFIADLAVGLDAGQIKTGAPARGERTAKYNRLLAIEDELGAKAKFAGEKALARD